MSALHDKIVSRLVSEALDDPSVGWLSNAGEYAEYEFAENDGGIYINANYESVDVYQLASIVQDMIENGV